MPRFILNDETKQNSYGFKIRTSGINLDRFSANPVMLDGHNPSNLSVIGAWIDIKAENGQLSADTQFDKEDENAKVISGKVERGIIKGASMGIAFSKDNFSYENGELILEQCELLEASIVAIPSNANALRLYANGELLTETDVKEICLNVAQNSVNNFKRDMKKIQLSALAAAALGFALAEQSVEDVNEAIMKLSKASEDLKAKLQLSEDKVNAFVEKEKQAKNAKITEMVDLAVKEGRITADKKQTFIDLAHQNFDLAKSTLESLTSKQTFNSGVNTPAGSNAIKNMEDFQKLSLSEQLAFKNTNPEGYQNLISNLKK
ncbi:caudovirus prohead protease [Flavobacteriaceae bacterium Ap0902]|nr:caudovirus prohead protease [Flavobacteriaceae bacterium Ap0902]